MAIDPATLIPQRNPGLIEKFARRMFGASPVYGPQPAQQETTQSGTTAPSYAERTWDDIRDQNNDRRAIYGEADEMDRSSEETSAALDIIADNATSSEDGEMASFMVKSTNPQVQSILDETTRRARLYDKAYVWSRSKIKYGDWFGEICVNDNLEIFDVRMLQPSTMYRNQDRQGNLRVGKPEYDSDNKCQNKKGECAFEQHDPDRDDVVIAAFYPMQIVHGRWNWDGISPYGRSLLNVTRITWKKLKAEEEALIIGRLTRAMLKLAFYVDTTGQSATQKIETLRAFKASMTRRGTVAGKRENPFSVLTDYYMADEHYRVGAQVVQGRTRLDSIDPKNEGLHQINDVEHFHRKFLATLRVPAAYLTFEKQVNAKSTLTMQDVQFVRLLRRLQQSETHDLKQIYDTALILAAMDPEDEANEYEIIWPKLNTTDIQARADAFIKLAQAAGILLGTSSLNQTPVVSPEYVQRELLDLDDDDVEELKRQLDEQEAKDDDEEDEDHQRALELVKAGGSARAPSGPPASRGGTTNASDGKARTTPTGDEAKAKQAQGSNTAVRQEARRVSRQIRDRVRRVIGPEFTRIQDDTTALLQEFQSTANGNGHHPEGD